MWEGSLRADQRVSRSVLVPVVEVGDVRMCVNERRVGVWMAVAPLDRQARMRMVVVAIVVPMAMRMDGLCVGMHVRVPRREEEADAGHHDECRDKL